jgi:hypothetical protein
MNFALVRWMFVALVFTALVGCGKPSVKISAVSGEVRDIPVWEVSWTGAIDTTDHAALGSDLKKTKSRYRHPRYATRYVDRVRSELQWKHGVHVLELPPAPGRILINLRGRKVLSEVYPSEIFNDKASILDETMDTEALKDPDSPTADVDDIPEGPADFVDYVEVTIEGPTGKELARILIGQDDGKRVKPEFVAKVIAEALKKGNY